VAFNDVVVVLAIGIIFLIAYDFNVICFLGTNQKEFRRFLDLLKNAVKPSLAGTGRPKPIVLLDNASAHKTLLSKRALERKFQPCFQPAHR
jgi:hypothetical protein